MAVDKIESWLSYSPTDEGFLGVEVEGHIPGASDRFSNSVVNYAAYGYLWDVMEAHDGVIPVMSGQVTHQQISTGVAASCKRISIMSTEEYEAHLGSQRYADFTAPPTSWAHTE